MTPELALHSLEQRQSVPLRGRSSEAPGLELETGCHEFVVMTTPLPQPQDCPGRKISQRLPGLELLPEKKGVVSYEDLLTINRTKYSTFQKAAGLLKSEDFINEVLDDAASVINLTEEERQERILQRKEQINNT
ncbi:hypothetical protein TNCV_4656111 [Trichonephila clavipes]|nr:hypothetical protein TNCV_4656111 [Trichonephila clavipes]